ncbi:ParB N-terminal domain-containing protein [Cellulosimicrobium cellulans]|uniref:ParB/RepB/Spo0J family partition protein n=1 Tax=Cellulosimicrobium cellulans TaxID=1710 RepID=UPI001883EB1C|nr:ParB N-terminal domain-containing protein [Cellulosimicrobium cellulans]MBE9924822.1 ParB N-terminal domain-containing protein [Cellulosimicrobium cellulans]
MTSTTEAPATQAEATTIPEGVEFARVDPRTLVVGVNVRADADLTPEFVGSIKQHGVLQAVRARRAEDGTLVVLEGQRRTVAAVAAQQDTIPVQIVDGTEDEARRIIEQLAENDHRRAMRDSHRTAAFEQLALIGLSAAQIAKRTGTKKDAVASALTVAGSKIGTAVQAKYDLPLDVAAAITEFEDDPETVKSLTAVAVEDPSGFAHAAQRARDDRQRAAEVAAARDTLAAQSVTEVPRPAYDDAKIKRLDSLKPAADDANGTALTVDAHAECPGHAAYISAQWQRVEVVYVCTNWRKHGHGDRHGTASTQRTGSMSEAEKAERRRVIENNKAWKSAEVVRRKWLADFAKRKTAPTGAAAFIAAQIATSTHTLGHGADKDHELAAQWLGIKAATSTYRGRSQGIAQAAEKATAGRAQHIALVLCLAACETGTGVQSWRREGALAEYLGALESWGYPLSDIEKIARGKAPKK